MKAFSLITLTGALMLTAPVSAQDQPFSTALPRNWSETLREDARAFHDRIATDHPGPFNRLDPGFGLRNDQALSAALRRAGQVLDYPGYFWAMRAYVASFDDGHVQFSTVKGSPLLTARWPGFLTGLDGHGTQVVMTRADDAPVPLGARLLSCDGVAADRLFATNVGAFTGRWMLQSQRVKRAGRLFIDMQNPFIHRPSRCRFTVDGKARDVTLQWRTLEDPEWSRREEATAPWSALPAGVRTLADGTRWFALPSFQGDPDGPVAKALRPMIDNIRQNRTALLTAPRIVFDLRGNGGGSSQWSEDIARALWGDAAVDAADRGKIYIEWRPSDANIATIAHYKNEWESSSSASPEALRWVRSIFGGLTAARNAGHPLWREEDDPADVKPRSGRTLSKVPVPVYVLTDWNCASACLDAVDLWTALGAIVVGRETSADTNYMEVGGGPLPSGLADVGIPMKVWRGRPRGSNVPEVPRYHFDGMMNDTVALEKWIASLPPRRG